MKLMLSSIRATSNARRISRCASNASSSRCSCSVAYTRFVPPPPALTPLRRVPRIGFIDLTSLSSFSSLPAHPLNPPLPLRPGLDPQRRPCSNASRDHRSSRYHHQGESSSKRDLQDDSSARGAVRRGAWNGEFRYLRFFPNLVHAQSLTCCPSPFRATSLHLW